ncbi:MAG: hypothetical protein KGI41_00995 [Patescibacteria group bacterium]|nr:hypothetical protein [Patescibacteria group bacterium]MDE1965806.1 hypothetical protein [Patescibacteria group bacterium]
MRNSNRASRVLWKFLPLALIATGAVGYAMLATQQVYRQSLNDPQVEMAEDAAAYLAKDYAPAALFTRGAAPVDISTSLAPWLAVYDASGTPLESDGVYQGAPPRLPQGVFDTSKWNARIIGHHMNNAPANENRFSWQTASGVREAVVLVAFTDANGNPAYVAAGRNMREAENREAAVQALGFAALGAILIALLALLTVLDFIRHRA